MAFIFHITGHDDWQRAHAAGQYTAPSLASEGFIHASTRQQVLATAERLFSGRSDLVLLCIDVARVAVPVRYEPPVHDDDAHAADMSPDERFPHIYGALDIAAVVRVVPFPARPDGGFELPDELPPAAPG